MRFILTIILTLTFLLMTVVKTQTGESNDLLNNLPLISTNNSKHPSFILGDSLQTRDDRLRAEELSRKRIYGESSGGYGEAKIIAKDTQYYNCVAYSKDRSGIRQAIGSGGRSGINTQTPQVGAIGVEAKRVHATYIVSIDGDDITIHESNFFVGWITERTLHRDDFLGFIVS